MAHLGIKDSFGRLTRFEWGLWITSLAVVAASFLLSPEGDMLNLATSLIGVTALIFLAKGMLLGQILSVVFSVCYGVVAFLFEYWGEVITYVLMTLPMSVVSMVEWARNPYGSGEEVAVAPLRARQVTLVAVATVAVTTLFYFILRALHTPNLAVSTLSVATSFAAVSLTALRSPYYALGYALNDVVLIVLWVMATIADAAYAPMIACFVMFFINDLYGFVNWRRMARRQKREEN